MSQELQDILSKAGSAIDLAGLRRLAEGSLAAPEGEDGDAWLGLVSRTLTEAMKAALRRYRAGLASAMPYSHGSSHWEPSRLTALRAELLRRGLAGFICPRSDEHQGEYVAPHAERLSWLTGFSGSAGLAIVLADRAAIFVEAFFATAFFGAAAFFATAFLGAAAFLAAAFLGAAAFLATAFLGADAFFTAAFLTAAFFGAAFLEAAAFLGAAAFLAAAFLGAEAFFGASAFLGAAFLAAFFAVAISLKFNGLVKKMQDKSSYTFISCKIFMTE